MTEWSTSAEAASETVSLRHGLFCNRTLNMRTIRAIGYDMDYTLIHYRMREWEHRAYEHIKVRLLAQGWPVSHLEFDPELTIRGLIIDTELGNLLKANRFGYTKRAYHGTRLLDFDEQRDTYARVVVDLVCSRYVFLNTLFSVSEACIYAQLVDLYDAGGLPAVAGYAALYHLVRRCLDEAHMEGELKSEIIAEPERFVELDPETPQSLLDQRMAGKKLLLITNSEWHYTRAMMSYAFDRFLPGPMTWRELFDVVIVSARKPDFFSARMPLFELVDEQGLLRPATRGLREGGVFLGGAAAAVEELLGASGEEILYVGDHIFVDVHVSKNLLRWRTALILHELDAELAAIEAFRPQQRELERLMADKEDMEQAHSVARLQLQRLQKGYGDRPKAAADALKERMAALRAGITEIDVRIAPLARASNELSNVRWGLLLRTGNDKSHLARQVERYADIYTSRVSNFLYHTPYVYLRSPRGSLPHDPGAFQSTPRV